MAYTTIKKPSDYFRTKLYQGNSTDNTTITWDETDTNFGSNLFLWLKARDLVGGSAQEHWLTDSVRGATKFLESNSTNAEVDVGGNYSYTTNGFVLDNSARTNRGSMVGWGWNTSGSASSNTDGTISSTVSVNTNSGFSIVSYTGNATAGATVGHGLGVAPKLVIAKVRDTTNNWGVYIKGTRNWLGEANNAVYLDSTSGAVSDGWLNNTQPSSSVVTLSGGNYANTANAHIMYCFSEVKGFSKISDYLGNGSTDGTFVYTGFKPKFLMIKSAVGTGDWVIYDGVKEPYNGIDTYLEANSSNADTTLSVREIDILSNGFKVRGTNTAINDNGGVFGYVAFAEEPLVGDNPCTAR